MIAPVSNNNNGKEFVPKIKFTTLYLFVILQIGIFYPINEYFLQKFVLMKLEMYNFILQKQLITDKKGEKFVPKIKFTKFYLFVILQIGNFYPIKEFF